MVKYLVMDVDGTLTDGKIYMSSNGELFKVFDIKDGCGIHDIAISNGITPIIITARESDILKIRCMELGITNLYQGVLDKLGKLMEVIPEDQYHLVAYIGDDINDLSCMEFIKKSGGIIGCPADASNVIQNVADYICKNKGGNGAVREFIEKCVEGELE